MVVELLVVLVEVVVDARVVLVVVDVEIRVVVVDTPGGRVVLVVEVIVVLVARVVEVAGRVEEVDVEAMEVVVVPVPCTWMAPFSVITDMALPPVVTTEVSESLSSVLAPGVAPAGMRNWIFTSVPLEAEKDRSVSEAITSISVPAVRLIRRA